MNPSAITIIAVCALAHGAFAQYGANGGYGNQRKMAPVAQTYGHQQQQSAYGNAAEQQQQSAYGGAAAALSAYDTGASNSYGAGKQSAGYGRQAGGYGAQAAAGGYAKSAARYEEPSYPPMPFAWGYDINDGYGGAQYHKETGDEYGKRTGSYGYTDAYGVYRQVDYVADEHGFRATIKTNEPGTANESPADVELHAYEPPSNYYAGNTNSYGAGKQSSSYGGQSNSYGGQQASGSSYGGQQASGSSYGGAASAGSYGKQGATAYGGQSNSYGAQQASGSYGQQANSYQAAPQRMSSYAGRQQSAYAAAPSRQMGYGGTEQYASSAIVPAYSKAPLAKRANY